MSDHCDEALTNLYTYLDGELTDAELARRIREHLEECPPCGNGFRFEQRLQVVIRQRLHEVVPERLVERLRVVIRQERLG